MKRYRAIAEYYDSEYEHMPMLRQDVPFLLRHLPKTSQDILELATGTARAAIPLAQAGHRVIGVDYARDMLAVARRKRDGIGLTDRELKLVRADVTKLNLGRKFDWIVILFNTFLGFTTLAEQDRVLQIVQKHLKPRGQFWIDIFQPNLELLAVHRSHNLDPRAFYVPTLDRTVFESTDVVRDPAHQVQDVTFTYKWFDKFGREHKDKVKFQLTFIFPRELQILLERNGLKIDKLWGNYDGSKLTSDSPRMIAMCSRT